ncbi:Autotransporter domain-containing protein [Balamuthia mandrillaris]
MKAVLLLVALFAAAAVHCWTIDNLDSFADITRFDIKNEYGEEEVKDILRTIGSSDISNDMVSFECDRRSTETRTIVAKGPRESPARKATRVPRAWMAPKAPKDIDFGEEAPSHKIPRGTNGDGSPSAERRNFYPNPNVGIHTRNFWRVSKLFTEEQHLQYPWSTIVKIATIDAEGEVVHCTGSVIGQTTVLTSPLCVFGASAPPVIFTGYNGRTYQHAFLTEEIYIPVEWDPCTFTTTMLNGSETLFYPSTVDVPVPSLGSWAFLKIAPNEIGCKKGYLYDIGTVTGTLGLGAVYLPDLATLPGYDSRRNNGRRMHILDANVETIFGHPYDPETGNAPGFYDDWFNVEGEWEARGAPAIVNFDATFPQEQGPPYWPKLTNTVSGVVSNFASDLEGNNGLSPVVSSSGSLFGDDFKEFLFKYCTVNCDDSCMIDHACGNGRIDAPSQMGVEYEYFKDTIWYIPEECDLGVGARGQNATWFNSDAPNAPSRCRLDCTPLRCGDGIVDDLFDEMCDFGDGNCDGPECSCSTNCQIIVPIQPITALDDHYGPFPMRTNTPRILDILTNDTTNLGQPDPTSVRLLSTPNIGAAAVTVNADGTLTYNTNTNPNFIGRDCFDYAVDSIPDILGRSFNDTAQVCVDVSIRAISFSFAVLFGTAGNPYVAEFDFLAPGRNTPMADPETITVTSLRPAFATVQSIGGGRGRVTVTALPDFPGDVDSFLASFTIRSDATKDNGFSSQASGQINFGVTVTPQNP